MRSPRHGVRRRCARKSRKARATRTARTAVRSRRVRSRIASGAGRVVGVAPIRGRSRRASSHRKVAWRAKRETLEMRREPATPATQLQQSRPAVFEYISNAAGRTRRRFHKEAENLQMTTQTKGVTAKDVAELRARTGAGMMDCKAALEETKGDMDAAVEALRKKGVAKAEK